MQKAIHWFSKNHVAANFVMLLVLLAGFSTWFKLRKEVFPNISLDAVLIQVPFPNATPEDCLLYTSPSPRDKRQSRMPSSA